MGNGEWGVGNGEWGALSGILAYFRVLSRQAAIFQTTIPIPYSLFPIPHPYSLLPASLFIVYHFVIGVFGALGITVTAFPAA